MTRRRAGCGLAAALVAVALAVLLLVPEQTPGPARPWIAEAGHATGFLERDGSRIRYVRAGSGPPVVLLHGFASSVYTWKDVLPALAASHEVVAFDFPGFGESSIRRPASAAEFPALVLSVMDDLGLARASLVGNSLGGGIAVLVAAERPERVDRLVLIDSAGFNLASSDRPLLLRAAGAPPAAALLERLPIRRRLIAAGLRQVFHDDAFVTDERIDAYARPLLRPGAMAAAAELLRTPIPGGIVAQVGRVRAPTLVIWGREDAWIPVAHAARFTAAIPGSTAIVFDACGHLPQEEKPAETAAAILRFLGDGSHRGTETQRRE